MATLNQLKDALKDALDKRGTLNELKAKVRSEVYSAIDDTKGVAKPEPSEETEIINELIREYLKFNNYRNTLSVMIPGTLRRAETKQDACRDPNPTPTPTPAPARFTESSSPHDGTDR
mmetsp:Transcript_9599/g.24555  ORF Transcript_9599/g.24555 Transcript_9599/m.24555 type:complete len:118 (-) Transcript_9599:239-592(-)